MSVLSVALTGGIGAGKTTVARLLAQRGAILIDSDVLSREVVEPGTPGLEAIVERFGPAVLAADGSLDRQALGTIIFADAQAYADAMLRHCHPAYVSWDRVHPNIPGHNVLAHALLDAIGFDFNRKA